MITIHLLKLFKVPNQKANMAESNAKLYADDKFNKRYSVIFFDGTANGVGSTLYLNESLDQFILLIFMGLFQVVTLQSLAVLLEEERFH